MKTFQFEVMDDRPNVQWENGQVVFWLHAAPIKCGPYPSVVAAKQAFKQLFERASEEPGKTGMKEETPSATGVSLELARENGFPRL